MEFQYNTYREDEIKIRYSVCTETDEYFTVAHAFLQKLVKEFARLGLKCYRPDLEAYNMPYMYSERRLDTLVLPALSSICNGLVLAEMPVERKDKKSGETIGSGHGRVDYWCIFRDYTFVIEMKGSKDRFNHSAIRQNSIINRWKSMVDQLEESEAECKNLTENTKGVIRLGLHFVTSFEEVEPTKEVIDGYRAAVDDYINAFNSDISSRTVGAKYNPSYAALWVLPEEMVFRFYDATYPGVMLLAKILKPVRHK